MMVSIDRSTIHKYLGRQKTTLWGRSFNVLEDDSKENAVDFILQMINDIAQIGATGVPNSHSVGTASGSTNS